MLVAGATAVGVKTVLIRSFLFAPGSNPNVMRKALAAGADAAILDLEDAVAVNAKEKARENVKEVIAELAGEVETKTKVLIRINSWDTPWGKVELSQLQDLPVWGFVIPKAQDPGQLNEISHRMASGKELIPLIETALGVVRAYEIAQVPKVSRLAFGAMDFTLDIGTALSESESEIFYARSHLVVASRAANIDPPVDTVYPDLQNPDGLRRSLSIGKRLGMFGKLLIHPRQIALAHEAFTPTVEEIDYARRVVAAFSEAEAKGVAAVQVDGKMVDYPVAARAKKLLDLVATQITG